MRISALKLRCAAVQFGFNVIEMKTAHSRYGAVWEACLAYYTSVVVPNCNAGFLIDIQPEWDSTERIDNLVI